MYLSSCVYLVRIRAQGNTEGSGKAEVTQFEVTLAANEQVLWLQVAVQNAVTVAIEDTLHKLGRELLDHCVPQTQAGAHFRATEGFTPTTLVDRQSLHVLLQVKV